MFQTNVKNGGKQTATKKERRLQQGQITEQKVIKRRRNVRMVYMDLDVHEKWLCAMMNHRLAS